MKFKLNEDLRIGGTVISEGSIVEVIEEKDRVASTDDKDWDTLVKKGVLELDEDSAFHMINDYVHTQIDYWEDSFGEDQILMYYINRYSDAIKDKDIVSTVAKKASIQKTSNSKKVEEYWKYMLDEGILEMSQDDAEALINDHVDNMLTYYKDILEVADDYFNDAYLEVPEMEPATCTAMNVLTNRVYDIVSNEYRNRYYEAQN